MLKRAKFDDLSSARRWAVLVCLLLVGIAMVAQSLHLHPNDLASGAKHCTVCHVAHAPGKAASAMHVDFGLATTGFSNFSNDPDPTPVPTPFPLFSRPPPSQG